MLNEGVQRYRSRHLRHCLSAALWLAVSTQSVVSGQGVYVIGHMTNSEAAINWALADGANAVEMDLQFDANGSAHSTHRDQSVHGIVITQSSAS